MTNTQPPEQEIYEAKYLREDGYIDWIKLREDVAKKLQKQKELTEKKMIKRFEGMIKERYELDGKGEDDIYWLTEYEISDLLDKLKEIK